MKILANDGISQGGVKMLEEAGYEVIQTKVAQEQLTNYINKNNIEILLVRSATQARKAVIDACNNLKLIGRGGVGLDNIDVEYAREKGVEVINTPSASSRSVAEMVFAHLLGSIRYLHQSNREMPLQGETDFKALKKSFKGRELYGKTLGIIGFGRIGHAVAQIALGIGMRVLVYDPMIEDRKIGGTLAVTLTFADDQKVNLKVKVGTKEEVLTTADFVTLHVPAQKEYVIDTKEIELMKDSAGLINVARGGVVNDEAVDKAVADHKLSFAALDVFETEPKPAVKLLMNPNISLSPHVGGSTDEAQERIGQELAEQIIDKFGKQS